MNGTSLFPLACLTVTWALPGCVVDFDAFDVESGSDCLTADEVVDIDVQAALREAKSPSPTAATLDRWTILPDSAPGSLHLQIAACPVTEYSIWQTASVDAQVDADATVRLRYGVGNVVGDAAVLDYEEGVGKTWDLAIEGGDLELWIDSTSARLDRLTVEVTCSDVPQSSLEDEEYFGDEEYYGDDC